MLHRMNAKTPWIPTACAMFLASCDTRNLPTVRVEVGSDGLPSVNMDSCREIQAANKAKEMITEIEKEFGELAPLKLPVVQAKGRTIEEVIRESNRQLQGVLPKRGSVEFFLTTKNDTLDNLESVAESDLAAASFFQRRDDLQALISNEALSGSGSCVGYSILHKP